MLLHKARKPKFELTLQILDLNNLPLTAGTVYVKWHLPTSLGLAPISALTPHDSTHHGHTHKSPIQAHKVVWNYSKTIPLRLHIDKNHLLQEQHIDFTVLQELSHTEKLVIGKLRLNLAEYADAEGGEGMVVRRYLMQDSKINSTLKIGIGMVQVEGDRNFIAPSLKSAAVFEGFTGVIAAESTQDDAVGPVGKTGSIISKEVSELQDMYRLALAASWASGANGELAADRCVEDIFSGGDGWGNNSNLTSSNATLHPDSRRGSHRTWTNGDGESEDEGMGTATPSNQSAYANRTRRNGTPRGNRFEDEAIRSSSRPNSLRNVFGSKSPSRAASAASNNSRASKSSRGSGQSNVNENAGYDPIAPLSRIHFQDSSHIPGSTAAQRAAEMPALKARRDASGRREGGLAAGGSIAAAAMRPKGGIARLRADMDGPLGVPRRVSSWEGKWDRDSLRGALDGRLDGSGSSEDGEGWGRGKKAEEVGEWCVREDLRAWKVPVMALEEAGMGTAKGKEPEEGLRAEGTGRV